MIRAVYFDLGGVLLRTEDLEPRRRWEARFGLPDWGLAKLVFDSHAAQRATLGQAKVEDIWAEAGKKLALGPEELDTLQKDFWAGDRWDEDLLAFIRSLRPRIRTGLISNAWADVRQASQAHVNEGAFDLIMYSAEECVMKPEAEIFRRALQRLGVAADEAIFVDDVLENVEAARALGMHGVHFTAGYFTAGNGLSASAQAQAEVRRLIEENQGISREGAKNAKERE
jgi:HAD superfamily hydrolase (TIGR01509 family)